MSEMNPNETRKKYDNNKYVKIFRERKRAEKEKMVNDLESAQKELNKWSQMERQLDKEIKRLRRLRDGKENNEKTIDLTDLLDAMEVDGNSC